MSDVALKVNGKEFTGWKTVRVTRGIRSIAGSFELSISDRWKTGEKPWAIYEEDECVLAIDGQPVITGYVDRRRVAYDKDSHSLTITGRDKCGALVDCSVLISKKWDFTGISVLKFVTQVAAPFGVSVKLQAGLTDKSLPTPPKKFSVDPGDTAFNAIENACRLAGLLPVSDGQGGLLLTRAGSGRTTTELTEGVNILSASGDFDASGRFRTYVVIGQHAGDDNFFGDAAAQVRGTAEDLNVRRSERVRIVRPEKGVTVELAKMRAQWEATHRAALADTVSVTVQGWTQGNGKLWPVNELVRVRAPHIGVKGEVLITEAVLSKGLNGTTTTFTLQRPDAYAPDPSIIKGTGNNYWKEIVRGV